MESLLTIRESFRPVQPGVGPSDGPVTYQEIWPSARMSPYIYCYWQLYSAVRLAIPFNYRVVADGCIDLFFELDRPVESFVMGFCSRYTVFELGRTFNYVGIRFLPGMFPQLFQMDASLLSHQCLGLKAIAPATARYIQEHVEPGMALSEVRRLLDAHFSELTRRHSIAVDSRLLRALGQILRSGGQLNVERDLDIGVSPRQLRRLFAYYVGDTAKTFCRVVRFQRVLHMHPHFYEAGYYDQAHFIKDFRLLYGLTPGFAFKR